MPDLNSNVFRIKRTIQRDPLKQFLCFFCWGFGAFRTHVRGTNETSNLDAITSERISNRKYVWVVDGYDEIGGFIVWTLI